MTTGSSIIKVTFCGKDVLRIRAIRNDHIEDLGYEDMQNWYLSDELTGDSLDKYNGDDPIELIKKAIENYEKRRLKE